MNSRFARKRLWQNSFLLALVMMAISPPSYGQGGMMTQSARPQRVPPGAQPTRTTEPPSMRMRVEDQSLTAQIRVTPLQQILEELAARTGIIFEIESQENPPISITFYHVSLNEALDRLMGNNNSIVYYDRDDTGQSHASFVRIFTRTPRPLPPSLRYIGTGSITKRGSDVIENPEQALTVLAESTELVARQKAIEVLVAARGDASVQALKIALADPAVEIRVAAIEGLASLGIREALPQILPALKDAHPGVRQSAVLAVSLLGDIANVKDLRPLVRDQDPGVAASADLAIRKLSARCP